MPEFWRKPPVAVSEAWGKSTEAAVTGLQQNKDSMVGIFFQNRYFREQVRATVSERSLH